MQIVLRTLTGRSETVDVEDYETSTFGDVKHALSKKYGVPHCLYKIILLGKIVDDDDGLKEKEVTKNTVLHLIVCTMYLTSHSKLKLNVVKQFFKQFDINAISIDSPETGTEQPFGIENTYKCARKRMQINNDLTKGHIISIENGVYLDDKGVYQDVCAVVMRNIETGEEYTNAKHIKNTSIVVPDAEEIVQTLTKCKLGFTKTFGRYLSEKHGVRANNWMAELCDFPREDQIVIGLQDAFNEMFI